jgi:hypothetical protein
MRYIIIPLLSIGVVSCGSDNLSKDSAREKNQETVTYQTPERLAERHVEADLKIPGNEEYSMKLYSDFLNEDDSVDYIITVNRYNKAMDDAVASDKLAKLAEIGYTGRHNHFYFMDGATKKISSVNSIASSPYAELDVSFEHITSGQYKDIMIDYHIMDSYFRNFYTIVQNVPDEILRGELFIGLGTKKQKAYAMEFLPGEGEARDVVVYEATVGEYQLEKREDIYTVNPKRIKTDKVALHWKFNPSTYKFFIEQDSESSL